MIDIGKWFERLKQIEQQLAMRLDDEPNAQHLFEQWQRIRLMKETLRLVSGTSEYTIEILAKGWIEYADWQTYKERKSNDPA